MVKNFNEYDNKYGRVQSDKVFLDLSKKVKTLLPKGNFIAKLDASKISILLFNVQDSFTKQFYQDVQRQLQKYVYTNENIRVEREISLRSKEDSTTFKALLHFK